MITKEALHKKTPQEITALLYEACLDNLDEAKLAIQSKNYTEANSKLQKASDIIHRLGAGINYEAGIVADQLDTVYNYIADKIIEANYKKDPALIDEAASHLSGISTAWMEAMKYSEDKKPERIKQQTAAYEKNAMYTD
ncbi:flagellar export chaperone FliS [Evansella sp. LMS18]|uniref:flagellar export chaperone FliS n=1 Tax=Evansella sp. LMS18 TaxID=2924033 RepID=UPI0020D14DF7|nr:flagellar export chaperone FliS [Evansella sp. LMS18]UTR09509.1 flagellar export chaperone FliS [Evansella sp. LMS18]